MMPRKKLSTLQKLHLDKVNKAEIAAIQENINKTAEILRALPGAAQGQDMMKSMLPAFMRKRG